MCVFLTLAEATARSPDQAPQGPRTFPSNLRETRDDQASSQSPEESPFLTLGEGTDHVPGGLPRRVAPHQHDVKTPSDVLSQSRRDVARRRICGYERESGPGVEVRQVAPWQTPHLV